MPRYRIYVSMIDEKCYTYSSSTYLLTCLLTCLLTTHIINYSPKRVLTLHTYLPYHTYSICCCLLLLLFFCPPPPPPRLPCYSSSQLSPAAHHPCGLVGDEGGGVLTYPHNIPTYSHSHSHSAHTSSSGNASRG